MIKNPQMMTREIRERMRGGTGEVELLHLFDAAELTARPG
jgi:hypothetical protein